jgi:signal transduction histidine kinase
MATTIFASGLSVDLMDNIDDVDEVMSDIFEEERVDRFIRIYQASDKKMLYANEFGQVADLPPPSGQKLSTVEYGHRKFRVLEVKNGPIILQVALIKDSFLSRAKVLEKNVLVFSGGLLMIILLITSLSLQALLKPLRTLGLDFAHWSQRLSFELRPVKSSTEQLLHQIKKRQAEWKTGAMREFLDQLLKFAQNLSSFLEFSQKQYSVLAHELKTPLTIIRNDLEGLKKKYKVDGMDQEVKKIENEIDELSTLIRNFLEWSHNAATASKPDELYAIKLGSVIQDETVKLSGLYPNRIQFESKNELQVFCSPEHARQLVGNLLRNAIFHGPENSQVNVRINGMFLEVEDQGRGISEEILQNLGAPFNRSKKSAGHGLGLAWIKTICDIYDWKLSFEKKSNSHIVRVEFSPNSAEITA